MNTKQLQTIANNLLDSLSPVQISIIVEHGYVGALPEGLDADDRTDLLKVIQDTAICIQAGAVRRG
jgi:hypothetical protein